MAAKRGLRRMVGQGRGGKALVGLKGMHAAA